MSGSVNQIEVLTTMMKRPTHAAALEYVHEAGTLVYAFNDMLAMREQF